MSWKMMEVRKDVSHREQLLKDAKALDALIFNTLSNNIL